MTGETAAATTPQYREVVRAHEHAVAVIADGLRDAGWEASVYDTARAVLGILFSNPGVLYALAAAVDSSTAAQPPVPQPMSPAVLAEDLWALADVVPFDESTRDVLNRAADYLDGMDRVREASV